MRYTYEKWKRQKQVSQGVLTVKLVISSSGLVKFAEITKKEGRISHPEFENELISKVKKWKFRPVSNNQPNVSLSFPITFRPYQKRSVQK